MSNKGSKEQKQDYKMNKIGSLGPVVFVVAEGAIRTIDEFKRSSSSRWAQHDIIGKKPKKEFLGPGQIRFLSPFISRRRLALIREKS